MGPRPSLAPQQEAHLLNFLIFFYQFGFRWMISHLSFQQPLRIDWVSQPQLPAVLRKAQGWFSNSSNAKSRAKTNGTIFKML